MTFPLPLPPRSQGPRMGALVRRQGGGRSAPFSEHGPAGRVVRLTGTMQLTPRSRATPFVTAIARRGFRIGPKLFSCGSESDFPVNSLDWLDVLFTGPDRDRAGSVGRGR